MYNFGDEFTIESYRIPCLVWIQVMVMVLLLLLLYCFSLLVVDLSDDDIITTTTTTTKPSPSASRLVSDGTTTSTTLFSNRLQNTQGGESIKGEIVTSTSRLMRREERVEMEASAAAAAAATHIYFHPCYYFRLARLALLKCLGFDSTSENSPTPQRGKSKES